MLESKCRYSVLFYKENIDRYCCKKIIEYLKNGIKVYLITNVNKDAVLANFTEDEKHIFNIATKEMLLNILYNTYIDTDSQEIYYDGNIYNTNFYNQLSETKFNIEQYKIEHEDLEENIIVKSGAGTGKTKVMIDRALFIKHMKEDIKLSDIVMITFTREATKQMKNKLSNRLDSYYMLTKDEKYLKWIDELSDMKIMTIHSYAKYILQNTGQELGFPSTFKIRSYKYERRKMLEENIDKFNEEYPEIYEKFEKIPQHYIINNVLLINSFLDNYSINLYNPTTNLDFGEDDSSFNVFLDYLVFNLNKELVQIKKEENNWEITDLMKYLTQLENIEKISEKIKLKYIMVDEFQDTDIVQVRFILWLFDKFQCKLFAVGDIKQSIYRFRGADYTAFEQLKKGLEGMGVKNIEEHTLNKNYRSCEDIIYNVNKIFTNVSREVAKFKFTKDDLLKSMIDMPNAKGLVIKEVKTDLGKMELLKNILKEKEDNDTVAILVRTNEDVRYMVDLCQENNIYCEAEISGDFFRHIAVREFYLLVYALIFKDDSLAQYSLSKSSYGSIPIYLKDILNSFSPNEDYLKAFLLGNNYYNDWKRYFENITKKPVLDTLIEIIKNKNPAKNYAINLLKNSKNIHDMSKSEILDLYNVYYIDYEKNLEHLIYLIQKNFSDKILTINELEKYLRIEIQTNEEENAKKVSKEITNKKVLCMTVHKAKGLEFDYVFLPITNHEFFVSNRKVQIYLSGEDKDYKVGYKIHMDGSIYRNNYFNEIIKDEKDEIVGEEIRLFYVAMTRAKKGLYIHQDSFYNRNNTINKWADVMTWREGYV